MKRTEALQLLAFLVLCIIGFLPSWWKGATFGLAWIVGYLVLIRLPMEYRYKHMIALTAACSWATWPSWTIGFSFGVLLSAFAMVLGWTIDRSFKRGRDGT